jgi:hypothetical protein
MAAKVKIINIISSINKDEHLLLDAKKIKED